MFHWFFNFWRTRWNGSGRQIRFTSHMGQTCTNLIEIVNKSIEIDLFAPSSKPIPPAARLREIVS